MQKNPGKPRFFQVSSGRPSLLLFSRPNVSYGSTVETTVTHATRPPPVRETLRPPRATVSPLSRQQTHILATAHVAAGSRAPTGLCRLFDGSRPERVSSSKRRRRHRNQPAGPKRDQRPSRHRRLAAGPTFAAGPHRSLPFLGHSLRAGPKQGRPHDAHQVGRGACGPAGHRCLRHLCPLQPLHHRPTTGCGPIARRWCTTCAPGPRSAPPPRASAAYAMNTPRSGRECVMNTPTSGREQMLC